MKHAIIYKPTKNLMQSGSATASVWKLIFKDEIDKAQEHLMGWTSAFETQSEIILKFKSKEDAIKYAQKANVTFTVIEPEVLKNEKKDVTFNFSKNRNLYYF
jgi:hypothetical protein